jgi:DNA recombination protein RmuC
VWRLLGAVKTDFVTFGDLLAKTKKQLDTVSNTLGDAEVRTRAIERKLRGVEALPEAEAAQLLAHDKGSVIDIDSDPEPDTEIPPDTGR